jgi:hypothetical protein
MIDLGCPPERRLALLRPAQRVPHSSDGPPLEPAHQPLVAIRVVS